MQDSWEDWSDSDFIGYCETHCETPRALFNGAQINRLIQLARVDAHYPPHEWFSIHEPVKTLCALAREHLGK